MEPYKLSQSKYYNRATIKILKVNSLYLKEIENEAIKTMENVDNFKLANPRLGGVDLTKKSEVYKNW